MLQIIGFTMFSLKNVGKTSGFASKEALKPKKMKKSIGFIVKNVTKIKKNHWFYVGFLKKRVVKPIPANGFGPWISHTRLEML